MQQGSPEWHQARLGKLTASRIKDAVARTKTGWGASRANLMATLICERLTGQPTPSFTSDAMRWGTETEPQARAAYSLNTGIDVEEIGFIDHAAISMAGASPDGLIGDVGLLEIKCPNTATHLDTLLRGDCPADYIPQMQWQMACTARGWCDFASFDPRLPEPMRLFVVRVHRDEALIAELETMAREFLAELDGKVETLRARFQLGRAA